MWGLRVSDFIIYFVTLNLFRMNKHLRYAETDKMSELICENYKLLLVMSRFGLSLGFGDQTVKQVCEQQGVHTGTFLAVVNFMEDECCVPESYREDISVEAFVDYLRRGHSYFLDFNLPVIRRKLIDAIDCSRDDVAFLILKFFDAYVNEVRAHMEYENEVVFKYVYALLEGREAGDYSIGVFAARHNQIETKLTELKNIIVKYYPAKLAPVRKVFLDASLSAGDLDERQGKIIGRRSSRGRS